MAAYALFAGPAWYARRHPQTPSTIFAPDVSRRRRVRHVLVTAAGGFGAFLAIVMVFHVWLAGQRAAFRDALIGGVPRRVRAVVFLAISAVERRLRR